MMINNYGCTPDDGKTCNAVQAHGPEPIAAIDKNVKVTAWITPTGGDDQDADFEGNGRQS